MNLGVVGHVDHGKTTLVNALSGVWTDKHSEELKRGISIRLGYADATFRKCPKCPEPDCYTVAEKCEHCGSKTNELRTVSFVDSPGHETLMATMLSGAAIMDGAILVIAASEPCPQPQTKEHLMALDIIGIDRIVIVQNKIDLLSREEIIEHYWQIKEFVEGTVAEKAPIVPVSAQQKVNIDLLIQEIEETIPTPERDLSKPARMLIARSFDVNKPGTPIDKIKGGVIGGSLLQGRIRVGDEIEIRPGRSVGGKEPWQPMLTKVTSIMSGSIRLEEATPGGLVGIGTTLDPAMTKSDSMVGHVVGKPGTLPPVWNGFKLGVRLLERAVGTEEEIKVMPIKVGERFMLSVGTATTLGVVKSISKDAAEVRLSRPVCAEVGARVAISRRIGARWHLIGVGTILEGDAA